MRQTTVKIDSFRGINNAVPPSRAGKEHLQVAMNVDVADDGRSIRRRGGFRLVYPGSRIHSVHNHLGEFLFREGDKLMRYEGPEAATELVSGMADHRTVYLTLNGATYLSDGCRGWVYQDRAVRSWGLDVPRPPMLTSVPGDMLAGRYMVVTTAVRGDGQESGASRVSVVEGTGVQVTVPASTDPHAVATSVYMTGCNGDMFYRVATINLIASDSSLTFGSAGQQYGPQLATALLSPPPAGSLLEYYRGRVYIASGNVLWYTEPWQYELVSLRHNFILFPGEITMVAAADAGLWVSAAGTTSFYVGMDPELEGGFRQKTIVQSAAVKGTSIKTHGSSIGDGQTQGTVVVWTSTTGICMGTSDGIYRNLTGGVFLPPPATLGSAVQWDATDITRYIVGLRQLGSGAALTLPSFHLTATGIGG